jgi:hypothetical protein
MHNTTLAKRQGVDETACKVINHLHILRDYLNDSVAYEDDADHKKAIYSLWFENEKLLQKLWNFPEDENYIKFWTFSACSCPKEDNEERFPIGNYIQHSSCPIHAWKVCDN